MQKARHTVSLRNHLRLWLAPFTVDGQQVWVGQISRDIGIKLTTQVWYLTTHRISPAVDQDRFYLLQDLIMSGAVSRFGFVQGVGVSSMPDPRVNPAGPGSDRWPSARSVPRHAATGLRSNRVSRLGTSSPVKRPCLRLQRALVANVAHAIMTGDDPRRLCRSRTSSDLSSSSLLKNPRHGGGLMIYFIISNRWR